METLIFTRVASDVNGNPCYSVDHTALMTKGERTGTGSPGMSVLAKRANSIGGRKMRGRWAFVFTSYAIQETANAIGRVTGRKFIAEKA